MCVCDADVWGVAGSPVGTCHACAFCVHGGVTHHRREGRGGKEEEINRRNNNLGLTREAMTLRRINYIPLFPLQHRIVYKKKFKKNHVS